MASRKEPKLRHDEYQRAMKRALACKPFLKSDGKYLSRDEAHDRQELRKHK
ncbi:MAG TPA: hypothetical protein VII23_03630 [Terriglobales bacterium]|jgi:hypothetical protein